MAAIIPLNIKLWHQLVANTESRILCASSGKLDNCIHGGTYNKGGKGGTVQIVWWYNMLYQAVPKLLVLIGLATGEATLYQNGCF